MRNYCNEVLSSINSNSFISFLTGEGDYYISYSELYPGYQPTDISRALTEGVYTAYKTNPSVKKYFEVSLIEMANGSAFELYCAVAYFKFQLYFEKNARSPFKVSSDKIAVTLFQAISNQTKETMKKMIDHQGYNYPNAWEDIMLWAKIIARDDHIQIL